MFGPGSGGGSSAVERVATSACLRACSPGEISHLHVGFKGTMNAIYLKDLADKTRRGLRGRVEAGKSGGGKAFGYSVLQRLEAPAVTSAPSCT